MLSKDNVPFEMPESEIVELPTGGIEKESGNCDVELPTGGGGASRRNRGIAAWNCRSGISELRGISQFWRATCLSKLDNYLVIPE